MPEEKQMSHKEMMAKTGCQLVGLIRCVNEFKSEKTKKTYYSVDVDIAGVRMPVNIKLGESVFPSDLPEGELYKFTIGFQPTFDKKGVELVAK